MFKILVTGANGQLGSEIRFLTANASPHQFTFVDLAEVDLTSETAIKNYFENHQFDLIINCAAYTAVDLAEQNSEPCFRINAGAVKFLAEIAANRGTRFIHISTDYVFSGDGNKPLVEGAQTNPLSVYGKSKLEGERHVQHILPDAYILRTAWVYSTYGKNFVKTIAKLAAERPSLNVIYDQIGSPTYARDLAGVILIIAKNIETKNNDVPGLYHFSNEGAISWFDFAHAIVRHYNYPCKLNPIRTEEYKTLAVRPTFSLLDKKKIKEKLKIEIRHWQEALHECLGGLKL
jgi:dTDP-4-dehydrorhamnose reductase